MNVRKLAPVLLALAVSSCDQAPKANPSAAESYAVQLPLEPAAGGSLQRLALPPEALIALRRSDVGDVRVFDGRGMVVPLALVENAVRGSQHNATVPVYPVVGPVGALGGSGMSIRIEDNSVARVVTVDSASLHASSDASPAAVLLDTHALREPVNAIVLDADIPADQPITLTLATSANLKDWEPLAEKVLFRPGAGSVLLGGARIALSGVDLRDRYVGISWGGATGIAVRGASVITSSVAPPVRTAVATSGVALSDPHLVLFDLPGLTRLSAIRLTQAGPDGIIPVKLYGRDNREDPWTLLCVAMLRPGAGGTLLEISGPQTSSYRLVADSRTAGFSVAPKLELLIDPVELLVALSGTPPYRLVAGQPAAPATYLTLGEIAPQGSPPNLADLPQAKVGASSGPLPVVALKAGTADGAFEPRKLMLWAALLLGTLVLAFAAIRLLRVTAAGAPPKGH